MNFSALLTTQPPMGATDIIILAFIILAVVLGTLYFLNRWATKKTMGQQEIIDKNKQVISIYVIDKKKDLAKNINLPKVFFENLPKLYKVMKMNFVQAKVGPQIMTFICDKRVFNAMPVKKNVKVDVAGLYIVSIKGMKSEYELKQIRKEKKAREKEAKKQEKKAIKNNK